MMLDLTSNIDVKSNIIADGVPASASPMPPCPETSLDLRSFVWAPKLGLTGIQRIHVLKDCLILAGAGVGGGSLNYDNVGGEPGGVWGDLFNIPMTAHFIGGCAIGDSAATGVIDGYQRMYWHPGLHVADGSALTANLGVNPSLSITAQAERAMSLWPNKGEADQRPSLGSPYRRMPPVAPKNPAVPAGAPAALPWPTAAA
jgi:choline dehydrogenase-like flavoprotein